MEDGIGASLELWCVRRDQHKIKWFLPYSFGIRKQEWPPGRAAGKLEVRNAKFQKSSSVANSNDLEIAHAHFLKSVPLILAISSPCDTCYLSAIWDPSQMFWYDSHIINSSCLWLLVATPYFSQISRNHTLFVSYFSLIFVDFSMPLPVARCNDIVFISTLHGIRVGVYLAMGDTIMVIWRRVGKIECYCLYWARVWHGCGIFNVNAQGTHLVPQKHTLSIFSLKLFAFEYFLR